MQSKTQLVYIKSLFGTRYITNYAQSVVVAQQDRDEIPIMNKGRLKKKTTKRRALVKKGGVSEKDQIGNS